MTAPAKPIETQPDAKPLSTTVQRLMKVWADSLHTFTDADLAHEAERVEIFEPSPMADFMREQVDTELAARRGGAVTA